ncbi:MAG: dihydrolipoamide acetyltransferase family protein [Desulforhopalus sp.]
MTKSFKLPDLGEGVHEAEILAIPVTHGQSIKEGDIILEVETDKAAVEIPSPFSGTVDDILVGIGDTAVVGDLLITIRTNGEQAQEKQLQEPEPKSVPAVTQFKRQPVPASPSTRRLARELDINLHDVPASGAGGLVSREDVEGFAQERNSSPKREAKQQDHKAESTATSPTSVTQATERITTDFSKWGPVERQPFRSIRRATARQMSASWSQIPHVHCEDVVDTSKLEAFRQKHKDDIESAGGRLTMTLFAMKAAATSLKAYPHFNSSLDQETQEIIVKHYFHIGIAVDTENGLTVPVIRDVDRKSIKELAVETNSAISRARAGKLQREEMQGGTFTITNAGALGGSRFSAIINQPEVAILGLGQGRLEPRVVTDDRDRQQIVPRLIMPVMLCFDHRVVDGGDAIRFLRLIIDALEDPEELLITMT